LKAVTELENLSMNIIVLKSIPKFLSVIRTQLTSEVVAIHASLESPSIK
jgi:hypothetical protein